MRRPAIRPTLAVLLALSAAAPAAAQEAPSGSRLAPYVGLALGAHQSPTDVQSCGGTDLLWVAEGRAGVAQGRFSLEARASGMTTAAATDCMIAHDPVPPPENGVFREVYRTFGSDDASGSADLRLRYGGRDGMPLVASVGGGWLFGPGMEYLLAGVGLRTRGSRRLAVDLERHWYRATFEVIDSEYENHVRVRTISREERIDWWTGTGLRVGMELDVR